MLLVQLLKKGYNDPGFNFIAYIAVDIHGTVFPPTYNRTVQNFTYYPKAKEVLQEFSNDPHIKLIMFTSSHTEEIEKYIKIFESDGIKFDFINENPDIKTTSGYGNYDKKFYFHLLLEDKAGFNPFEHWTVFENYKKEMQKVL